VSEVQCVVEDLEILGESPVWSVVEQMLYWVDVRAPAIHRFDPETGDHRKWPVPEQVGSIGLASDARLIAALRTGFFYFNTKSGDLEPIFDPEPNLPVNRLNDGKMDPAGRFWCGSMSDPDRAPVGTLYRLDPDGTCTATEDGLTIPNALCWAPDGKTMYFADSVERMIRAYDFDPVSGEMSNRRTFVTVPEADGVPDGATVDAQGYLWSAHMRGWRVTRYTPDGRIDRVIELPCSNITSCGFGGENLDVLYITTARQRLTEEELAAQPLAGSLFAAKPGVSGIAEPVFGG
jgi:sugar lactone lactonase YvrE